MELTYRIRQAIATLKTLIMQAPEKHPGAQIEAWQNAFNRINEVYHARGEVGAHSYICELIKHLASTGNYSEEQKARFYIGAQVD